MSTFTKRISANLEAISDKYNSHWSPTWIAESFTYGEDGQIGVFPEEEVFPGEWSGGIRNKSYLFKNVTIPQGATITSAKITYVDNTSGVERTIHYKFYGVDEDNTGDFVASPLSTCRTRTHTTAAVDWDLTFTPSSGTERDSPDIGSIIQEIIDRAGWSSGNTIGIYLADDGTANNNYYDYKYYSSYPTTAPILTIIYETPNSPSVSPSSSASPSVSPSASVSPSPSVSPSVSSSVSRSPSPSPIDHTTIVLEVAKEGVDILKTNNPQDMKYSSRFGTLKYFTKSNQILTIQGDGTPSGDWAGKKTFTHSLGYYPFVEVFVRVYLGSTPSGNYEYVPLAGSGASVFWNASYIIKENTIDLYGEFVGLSSSLWTFDFLLFLYKNNLSL